MDWCRKQAGALTDESMCDIGHVSTGEQFVDDPVSLGHQKVHDVLDRRTVCCAAE